MECNGLVKKKLPDFLACSWLVGWKNSLKEEGNYYSNQSLRQSLVVHHSSPYSLSQLPLLSTWCSLTKQQLRSETSAVFCNIVPLQLHACSRLLLLLCTHDYCISSLVIVCSHGHCLFVTVASTTADHGVGQLLASTDPSLELLYWRSCWPCSLAGDPQLAANILVLPLIMGLGSF